MDAVLAALAADALPMGGISVAIVALFVAGEVLRRVFHAPAEATRKLAHVGGGVVVLVFPWLVHSIYTVAVLAVAFLGILLGGRITGILGSVHGVERRTSGAELYPVAVFGTWWLSEGEPLRFCVPMAVMAAADTGAALVGKKMGTARFKVMDGQRSLEGSLTFFAIAFAIFLAGLAIDGSGGWPGVLLIALIGATLTTCVEAISVRGADNLFVPWAGWLVLERTLRLGLGEMSGWITGMLLSLIGLLAAYEGARLKPAGAVTVFVFGTFAWAIGGPKWFVPLATLAVLLGVAQPRDRDADLEQVFPAVVGSVAILAASMDAGRDVYLPFLATIASNGAIGLARARTKPGDTGWGGWLRARPRWQRGAFGAMFPLISLVGVNGVDAESASVVLRPLSVVLLGALCGVGGWVVFRPLAFAGRRLASSVLAAVVAWTLGIRLGLA